MSTKLDLALRAMYTGGPAFAKASADIDRLSKRADQASAGLQRGLGNLPKNYGADLALSLGKASLAFAGVAIAGKRAYGVLSEGADLLLARDQFDRLSASINTTADSLQTKLAAATGGMMTSAEQIAAANQVIGLGMAKTEESVVRLVNVSSQLGWDSQQMVLTFANNSKMRLDALGLSVEDVEQRMERLRAAGLSADAAFDMAVIEAGEAKIALLGDRADTTAGKLMQLEVSLTNLGDSAKLAFAEMAAGPIDALAESLDKKTVVADMKRAFEDLSIAQNDQYKMTVAVTGSYNHLWRDGFLPADEMARRLTITTRLLTSGWEGSTQQLLDLVDAMAMGQAVAEGSLGAYLKEAEAIDEVGGAAERAALRISQMIGQMGFVSQAQWDAGAENRNRERPGAFITGPRLTNMRNMGDAFRYVVGNIDPMTTSISRLGREAEQVATGGFGSWKAPIDEAAEALAALSAESGDLFSRLRGQKEFNLAEELFGLGNAAGWSALDLSRFGVASGLFDQGRANELLNQSFLLQGAEQMIAAGLKGEELWAAIQGLQGQMGEGANLAQQFFSGIDSAALEPSLALDTDPAQEQYNLFADNLPDITKRLFLDVGGAAVPERGVSGAPVYGGAPYVVGGSGPAPSGGGQSAPNGPSGGNTYNVHNYNERAAALFAATLGLARMAER